MMRRGGVGALGLALVVAAACGGGDGDGGDGGGGVAGGTSVGGDGTGGATGGDGACRTDDDCESPDLPYCVDDECVACRTEQHCEGFFNICEDGQCVQQDCTETEEEVRELCGETGRYCQLLTGFNCTTTTCLIGTRICDDGDRCTRDSCSNSEEACVFTFDPPRSRESGFYCDNGIDDDCDGLTDMEEVSCGGCALDEECDDGNVCTVDACVDNACTNEPEVMAISCTDNDACTQDDVCRAGECIGELLDADGDGYGDAECGGDDCDDDDATRNPGVLETPGALCTDGIDNDCSGAQDDRDAGCYPVCFRGWCWVSPRIHEWDQASAARAPDGTLWVAAREGMLLTWDGTTWSAVDSGTTASFDELWISPAGHVWAASRSGVVVEFDGVDWTVLPPHDFEPQVTGSREVTILSLGGLDDDNVWIGGYYGAVAQWNGTTWTSRAFAERGTDGVSTSSIVVASSGDVYSGSSDGIHVNTGSGWTLASPSAVRDIFLIGDDDIWAAGSDEILHYDGTSWSASVGAPTGANTLWAAGPSDVFALSGTTLHAFDGTVWSELGAVTGSRADFYALAGTSATDVWHAGDNGTLATYDGTEVYDLSPGFTSLVDERSLNAVFFLDATHGWAAGEYGKVFEFDGNIWRQMPENTNAANLSRTEDNNYGLWALADDAVFLIGNDRSRGFLERWDGATWTTLGEGKVDTAFRTVWGTGSTNVYAGGSGALFRWDGSTLSEAPGAPSDVVDISGSGADDVWAVTLTALHHFDGNSWSTVDLPCSGVGLAAVEVTAPGDVWVGARISNASSTCASEGGWLGRYASGGWTTLRAGPDVDAIRDMWASGGDDVWLLATDLQHYTGTTWDVFARAGASVDAISGSASGSIWGVGGHRRILEHAR